MGLNSQEDLFYTVRQVLLAHWDPIGVHDFGIGDDEYDSYIPGLVSLLLDGAGRESIARYLTEVRTKRIGLTAHEQKDTHAADLLLEAHKKFQQALAVREHLELATISGEEIAFQAARLAFLGLTIDEMQSIINRLITGGFYHDAFYDVLYPDVLVTEVVRKAFDKSLLAMQVPVPSYEDAVLVILHYYLQKIVNRDVAPYEGLKLLMYEVYWGYDFYANSKITLGDSHGIDRLIGLFWTYDDIIEQNYGVIDREKQIEAEVAILEAAIYAEAKRWVSEFVFNPKDV